jgi:hypothetical protein
MINISVDGTSKRTFWRFHEWDGDPLTCQEFQAGTTDTLWQHMLWYTLYNHYMNLILNLGIKELTNTSSYGGEMLVDWIKVEQQVPFSSVQRLNPGPNPNYICQGETAQFQFTYAPGPYPVTEWTVSPNLQVLDVTHNPEVVTVKALTIYNGPGWVQARYWNPNSCFGSNTRLNVDVVGLPISPQISAYKTCSFISLKVDNASSANTYQWEILTPGYTGYPFSNGNGFNINMPSIPPPYPVTIAYRVLVTNLCGTTTYIGTVTTLPCNSWHLNVYPNPANTYINFELVNFTQSDLNQGLELTLIDANFSIKKTVPVTQLTQYMDVSDVEPGYHYAYVVVNGENVISNQFVIQH